MIYLVEELNKLDNAFKKLVADRDVKLTFLLKEEMSDAYEDVIENLDKIKSQINNLDINELVSAELEDIGETINKIVNYYNYFADTCENIKV
jgi:membrane-associated HD superfamily phosphohydrolase